MGPGWMQVALIAFVAVLLFGRGKISGMMEEVAHGIKSFKKGMADDESEIAASEKGKVIDHNADEEVGKTSVNDNSKAG